MQSARDEVPYRRRRTAVRPRVAVTTVARLLHRMRRSRGRERLAENSFDRRTGRGAALVLREMYAYSLGAVALHALGCDPDHLALHRDAIGLVHEGQQHENFLAELILSRRRYKDTSSAQERHVRGVQGGALANVERQHTRARSATDGGEAGCGTRDFLVDHAL